MAFLRVTTELTFCILSNFYFSINPEKSEQLLVLKLALLPYFKIF